MAADSNLPVLPILNSPDFPQAFERGIERLIDRSEQIVIPALGPCWFDDGENICREPGTVHLLGSDFEYCEYHLRKIVREGGAR